MLECITYISHSLHLSHISLPLNVLKVQYRLFAASIATVVSIGSFSLLFSANLPAVATVQRALGFGLDTAIPSLVVTVVLMTIFYAGPIIAFLHDAFRQCDAKKTENRLFAQLLLFVEIIKNELHNDWKSHSSTIVIYRNFVVAPISEELVFRSVLVPTLFFTLLSEGYSHQQIGCLGSVGQSSTSLPFLVAYTNPVWFAVAHMHHLIDKLRNGTSVKVSLWWWWWWWWWWCVVVVVVVVVCGGGASF